MLRCPALEERVGGATEVFAKLEFLQQTGTFKARGALATLLGLSDAQRAQGVTAVSAGNHAIATAFAAKTVGASAKLVMMQASNPARVAACEALGAEVVLMDDVHSAFAEAERIEQVEGRYFVHPFDSPSIAMGTGTLGLEVCEQLDGADAVIIPVGGGGLISGMANAIRQLKPDVAIYGVEPQGADSMSRSFAAGAPQRIDQVNTVADSLGAPFALPYSYELARANVDRIVLIDDEAMRRAMGWIFREMKFALEPACVASTVALLGPLRETLAGKRVVLTFCGSNIDWQSFSRIAVFDDQ